MLPLLLMAFQLATVADKQAVCPTTVSVLTNVPGSAAAITTAQRVEIRQCPSGGSPLQLIAFERDSASPSLVLNLDETGFHQIAMVEGVYAFELIGGKAQEALVIAFEAGKPRVALEVSTLGRVVFTSDRESLSVDLPVWDREAQRERDRHYVFPAQRGDRRR